jgi:predicted TIM-barrel fold metal-dependent hydrolase
VPAAFHDKGSLVTLIALEEHILPAELAGRIGRGLPNPPAIADALAAAGAERLEVMDAAGIDLQVLSVPPPAAQNIGPADAVALARELNDRIAAVVAAHPTRFRAMATLPTPDPAAAVAELHRAVGELGCCGVLINGHTHGRFLDAPEFEPVLAAIDQLGVPLYLHPTMPPPEVADIYFGGLEPQASAMLASAGWGWHVETGLHILRLVMGGVFDRHPGLQVVVGHMGENLPFSLMRADAVLSRLRPGLPSVAETVREHVHLTICGYTTVPPLQCALAVFGADRLLFSADYPYGDSQKHATFLAEAPIAPADREKIAHLNAERLFGL